MRWRRKRKEKRSPADCKRSLEQRPSLVERWITERAPKQCRKPELIGRAVAHGKRGVEAAGGGDDLTSFSRRVGLILDLRRFSDARQFDADFLEDRHSAGEAPAQRFDKAIVSLGAFGTGCGA